MRKIIFVLMVFLLGFTLPMEPLVDMNDIVPVFPGEDRGAIESSVVEGAVRYLQAKGYADLLLCEVEKSARAPFNYSLALDYTVKALGELDVSLNAYINSVNLANKAGYLDEVVAKFKTFDYDGLILEKQLDGDMMVLVKSYFSAGNIIGAYQQNVEHLGEIRVTLLQIKEQLSQGGPLEISLYWQLLQRFARASLFGNYCTVTATSVFNQ
jgi:hypothetical protein